MNRSLLVVLGLLSFSLVFSGCAGDREMKEKVLTMELQSKSKFGLLKQQNEFMNRKVNTLNEKVEELLEANAVLTERLAEFANRPDEIKIEIITEVNTRFATISTAQKQFTERVTEDVDTRFNVMENKFDTQFKDMNAVLLHHTEFVQFVSTEQDSINALFAGRIDSRPWYQSIIGKWEDKERAKAESTLP